MLIYEVCNAFNKAGIPYAIVGGYAVALHGVMRGTFDVDLVINWSLSNLEKAELTLKNLGLVSRLPIDAKSVYHFKEEYINNRNLIAWNFYDPKNVMKQVDIVLTYDLKNAHTDTVNTSSGKIKVLSRKDLIEMKKKSGRPQDLLDVKALSDEEVE